MFDVQRCQQPVLHPEYSQWQCPVWQPEQPALALLRQAARRSLVQAAERWTAALPGTRQQHTTHWLTGNPDSQPLVLTGHQPVVFHAGLAFKYAVTEQFAAAHSAIGVAILIDTDEGDAGRFPVPSVPADGLPEATTPDTTPDTAPWPALATQHISWTAPDHAGAGQSSGRLLGTGLLASAQQRALVTQQVQQWLISAGCQSSLAGFLQAAESYAALPDSGLTTAVANTVVRRQAGIGGRLLELPLSLVCGLPEVVRFLSGLLNRAGQFVQAYNESLQQYRQQQGIRNAANPFPDLRISAAGDGHELPLWLVDLSGGQRHVAWLWRRAGQQWLGTESGPDVELWPGLEAESMLSLRLRGQQLVPRGGLISALLRLLFADLFVHGLGGGKYDPAVDVLIRRWWGEASPGFVTASASRYLFPQLRAELQRLRAFADSQRDLQYNPDRFLGRGIFSAACEQRLVELLQSRAEYLLQLQQRRERGEGGRDVGIQLQRLTEQLRATATADIAPQLQALQQLPTATAEQLESRLWPWYFLD